MGATPCLLIESAFLQGTARDTARPVVAAAIVLVVMLPLVVACTPSARPGSLQPTLTTEDHGGVRIAMQNGIPVPTFEPQERRQIRLNGEWRVQTVPLSTDLSLTDRATSHLPPDLPGSA